MNFFNQICIIIIEYSKYSSFMMFKKLFVLLVLSFTITPVIGQSVPFSFSGNTINWDTKQDEYGVTIYFIQSQRTLSRVLSQQNGSFSIKAKINPQKPFELYFAKPGLITKKVLFYFNDKTKDSNGDSLKIKYVSDNWEEVA